MAVVERNYFLRRNKDTRALPRTALLPLSPFLPVALYSRLILEARPRAVAAGTATKLLLVLLVTLDVLSSTATSMVAPASLAFYQGCLKSALKKEPRSIYIDLFLL